MTNVESGLYDLFKLSVGLMLLAVLADFLDGAIARAMKAESEFGFMFDSLADAITFGVAPSVLFVKTILFYADEGQFVYFSIICAIIYSMCGVLRLVRFNVKSVLVKGNKKEELAMKRSFIGLPIPTAALAVVSLIFLLVSPQFQLLVEMPPRGRIIFIGLWTIAVSYLMICRWQFPSLKTVHFRVPSFGLIIATVIVAIVALYGILYYLPFVLIGLVLLYMILGASLSVTKFAKAKKISKRYRRH